jgi:DNA-binding transcriptional regulator YdaS (Cro superfamily)
MTLYEYFFERPIGSRIKMAKELGISSTWMSRLSHGLNKPSPYLAKRIEEATGGLVTRKELLPEIYGD